MENTAEFKTTRKKARRPKHPEAIAHEAGQRIETACAQIAMLARDHIDTLVLELAEDHGLKLPKAKNGRMAAKMHGIEGAPAANVRLALENWANAARRALLRAEG